MLSVKQKTLTRVPKGFPSRGQKTRKPSGNPGNPPKTYQEIIGKRLGNAR